MEEIKIKDLNLSEYKKDKKHSVVRHALSHNSLSEIVRSQDQIENNNFDFDINIFRQP